jgi:uncharacterized membrane protein YgcG
MRRRAIGLVGLWVLACAALPAADFWTKPFTEWSDKEAERMVTDSPWAAGVTVPLPQTITEPVGVGTGVGGGQGFGPEPARPLVTISWRSALPVRQAVLRTQLGKGVAPSPEQLAALAQPEPFYVVGISGLPPQYLKASGGRFEAFLKRKGKADIPAQQAAMPTGRGAPGGGATSGGPGGFGGGGFGAGGGGFGGGLVLVRFPREEITVEDREVEFSARVGPLEFGRKFKLADMRIGGKLEL